MTASGIRYIPQYPKYILLYCEMQQLAVIEK
jgi:uncharacterized protein YlbG (UPF0298 family)